MKLESSYYVSPQPQNTSANSTKCSVLSNRTSVTTQAQKTNAENFRFRLPYNDSQ